MVHWTQFPFSDDRSLNREVNRFFELVYVTGRWMVPTEQIDEIAHRMLADGTMGGLTKALGKELVHDSSISGETLDQLYAETLTA